ncbi:MAG: hypothetical protein LBR81_02255 [Prevotellaceae bacterium]|jgi:hypothetical protein|nr:hypothetical protein [Prevotellaceae bacterium]
MKHTHFLKHLFKKGVLLAMLLSLGGWAQVNAQRQTIFSLPAETTAPKTAGYDLPPLDLSLWTNIEISFEFQITNSSGSATVKLEGATLLTSTSYSSGSTWRTQAATAITATGAAAVFNIGRTGNYDMKFRNLVITGEPGCNNATFSFDTPGTINAQLGVDATITNTFTSNNLSPQKWTSSNPAIATVASPSGVVTILDKGSVTISVEQDKDAANAICPVSPQSYTLKIAAAPCFGTPLGVSTPAPVASAETEDGFTATWTAVPNASSYLLTVYQGSTWIRETEITGTSYNISGLQGLTKYTFTIKAVGDGVTYCDGAESANSNEIETLMPTVVITSPCGSSMISIFNTDFSGWGTNPETSSGQYGIIPGSNGWEGEGGIQTSGSGVTTGSSNRHLHSPQFYFYGGGSVVVEVTSPPSNNRTLAIAGASPASHTISAVGTYTFTFPPSFVGNKILDFTFSNGGFTISKMTICSNPGTDPILTYTLGTDANFSAVVGGNKDAKTLQVKGFNLNAAGVTLEVVGDYAGYFSLSTTTLDKATAEAGKNLAITYTSSAVPAIHDARLKISSPGADDVYVSLIGVSTPTAGTTPVIIAKDEPLSFATSVINKQTLTLNVAGVNLTGPITATISGTDKDFFTPEIRVIPQATATAGTIIEITYNGDIKAILHQAKLTLTSPGATSVEIDLFGETTLTKPEMFSIRFQIMELLPDGTSVPGTGSIRQSLGGTIFKKGTVLTVTFTPEAGYKLVRWNDGLGGSSLTRNFTMNSDKGTIIIYVEKGVQQPPVTVNGDFNVFPPTGSTKNTMDITWDAVAGASSYTVTVYDAAGNIVGTPQTGLAGTSTTLSGLDPNTLYKYGVEAVMPAPGPNQTTLIIGPFRTQADPTATFNCGF